MMMTHLAVTVSVLCLFACLGLRARKTADGPDDCITVRNSRGAMTIGLSFLASGMGAWILFAPPEVGALVSPIALAGYALGAALPFIVFAMLAPYSQSPAHCSAVCTGGGTPFWSAVSVALTLLLAVTAALPNLPGASLVAQPRSQLPPLFLRHARHIP